MKKFSIKKEHVREIFKSFNNLNVLIIGDVMIDSYLWGKVNRISPEAPVPIVTVQKKKSVWVELLTWLLMCKRLVVILFYVR